MNGVLLDTHVWAWTLLGDTQLSAKAGAAAEKAGLTLVSPVSFFEIAQIVRLGKWSEMSPFADRLLDIAAEQGAKVARLDGEICLRAGNLAWDHRDPFDRMLAATALSYAMPIISADAVFDGIVSRIW